MKKLQRTDIYSAGSRLIRENRQSCIRWMLALLLFSISFGYSMVEKPEKVYYISYGQMHENLENILYNEQEDRYILSDAEAALMIDLEKRVSAVYYMYLDVFTGEESSWRLEFLDGKGRISASQEIVLSDGANEVILAGQTFYKIRLIPNLKTGDCFRIENIELRTEGKDFLVKRFLVFSGVAFILSVMVLILVHQKGWAQTVNRLLQEMKAHVDEFSALSVRTTSMQLKESVKRVLRMVVFFLILIYVTYMEHNGAEHLTTYFSMYMWSAGGILLVLAGLAYEDRGSRPDHSWLCYAMWIYLACVLVSDFYLNKKFRYAGFGLIFMGGFFLHAWKSMRNPGLLVEEFKCAYKIYFTAGAVFCLVARPCEAGVHYKGFFAESAAFGIMMLVALGVFLDDFQADKKIFWNSLGAAFAFFFIWKTQKIILVFLAGMLIITGSVLWLVRWLQLDISEKMRRFFFILTALAVSAAGVWMVNKCLYVLPYKLGTVKSYAADVTEIFDTELSVLLRQGGWKRCFYDRIQICKTYLQYVNFWGNKNLTKYFNDTVWPSNSIVMNFFRYGMAGGIAYGMMTVLYLLNAGWTAVKQRDYLIFALALISIVAAMTEATERPFVNLNWYLFWFGMGYVLASQKKKYRDGLEG